MRHIIPIPLLFLLGCAATQPGEPSNVQLFAYGLLEDATAVAVVEIVAKNPETRDDFLKAVDGLNATITTGTIDATSINQAFAAVPVDKLSQEGRIAFTLAKAQFRRYGQRISINQNEHVLQGLVAVRNGLKSALD